MLKPVPAQPKILTPSTGSRSTRYAELFDVMPSVPVTDALERASALLAAARHDAVDVAMEASDPRSWAVVYLLESVHALVNASVNGMLEAKQ
ncbi:DUF3077 domain-containing protein [Stutzerimonas nitrititolerans]|uniref:DUF3077 domain-containing protein n=1 Tax=Stutzerimonas nitrititolerans TaxID=2482751 RepID=UPI0028B008FF|nr:DUF3077 domain-containing protein [Stutzerimonas nitrititolerans]